MEGVCVVVVKWQVRRATIAKLLILSCLESQSLNDAVSRSLRYGEVTLATGSLAGASVQASHYSLTSMLCEAEGRSRRPITRVTYTAYRKRVHLNV
jgi:hypothetical protein